MEKQNSDFRVRINDFEAKMLQRMERDVKEAEAFVIVAALNLANAEDLLKKVTDRLEIAKTNPNQP